ncbi:MAG: T9SS type A sorting domain-containing protein [Melioribacteraceae bacterium]|nr:T9SS type A sorting domain-containing protein [Melioribacteraceae bacterium]
MEYDKTNDIIYAGATANFDWSAEGALYKSTDGGSSWSEIFDYPRIVDIEINPQNPNEIFVAAQSWYSVWLKDQLPGVYRTTDAGLTWENITNNLQHTHVTFVKLDPNNTSRLFAGTGGGGLWSTDLSTDVEDENRQLPTHFELHQNYPNPFNPNTTIEYSIPESGFVTLKVYDILGKEVVKLVNKEQTSGNYEVEFNGYGLSSGLYFYRVHSGTFTNMKNLILIK